MQIRNSINLRRYLMGTFLNLLFLLKIFELNNFDLHVALFFLALIGLSQICLILFGGAMIGYETPKFFSPTLFGILKFILVIVAFYFALKKAESLILFLVLSYIFQLIILVISIKRVVKKN